MIPGTDIAKSGSQVYAKYLSLGEKVYMTIAEAEALSHDLATEILTTVGRPDLLVGIANGALLPTKIVSDDVGTPFEIVPIRRKGSRYKERAFEILRALGIPTSLFRMRLLSYLARRSTELYDNLEETGSGFDFSVRGMHVVLVDDAIYTGKSLRYAREKLIRHGAAKVTTAVLCWYKGRGDSGDWSPDIHLIRQDHYYPWSYSSPHLNDYSAWLAANDLAASA